MSAEKIWTPFSNAREESPFDFSGARMALKNAIQLAWTETPEWRTSPPKIQNLERMEMRLRIILDELLNEVRQDFDRDQRG